MSPSKSHLSFLNNDSYQIYNRDVARMLKSINAAIMLAELIGRYEYHKARNELKRHEKYGENLFYHTLDKAEERTCLSRKEQDTALKILEAWGFIKKCVFGLPAMRYFQLQEDVILQAFGFKKIDPILPKPDEPDLPLSAEENQDCPFVKNSDVPNGQTALYIKELKEELNLTTTTPTPLDVANRNDAKVERVVVVSSKDEDENEKLYLQVLETDTQKLINFLTKKSQYWGDAWNISCNFIKTILSKHSFNYVIAQVDYMIEQQVAAIKDERSSKKRKADRIEKPRFYLAKACQENFACCFD